MAIAHRTSDSLLKMSALARLSGVPAATIKHYLREGLLPQAQVKTGRNMAFYDPALVERIKRIKVLQREQFLPLRLIKSVLEGHPSREDDAEAAAAIERALHTMAPLETRTRAELLHAGMPAADLELFESLGLVRAQKIAGEDAFSGDDLSLLRLLGAARRAGITPSMLPADILAAYASAIRELVRVELEMFRHGVIPQAGADLTRLTDVATRLSEELVVLVRRKMLLPTLARLVRAHGEATTSAAASPRERPRAVAKRSRASRAPASAPRSKKPRRS